MNQNIEFCRRCNNRKFDPKQGILCKFTPDFDTWVTQHVLSS